MIYSPNTDPFVDENEYYPMMTPLDKDFEMIKDMILPTPQYAWMSNDPSQYDFRRYGSLRTFVRGLVRELTKYWIKNDIEPIPITVQKVISLIEDNPTVARSAVQTIRLVLNDMVNERIFFIRRYGNTQFYIITPETYNEHDTKYHDLDIGEALYGLLNRKKDYDPDHPYDLRSRSSHHIFRLNDDILISLWDGHQPSVTEMTGRWDIIDKSSRTVRDGTLCIDRMTKQISEDKAVITSPDGREEIIDI